MSVFMKIPNNNSVNYCESLFLEADEMAGPLNPESHSEIQIKILVSVLAIELKFQIIHHF